VTVHVPAARDAVFAILADGWSYAAWLVGCSRIRDADDDWPAKGTRIHHSIGPWPLLIEDTTSVLAVQEPGLLILEARLWPLGRARVRFDLVPTGDGTDLTMTEVATRGPIALLPAPLQARLIAPRNRESLDRLSRLAVAKADSATDGGGENP
jgi:hypothetical protein